MVVWLIAMPLIASTENNFDAGVSIGVLAYNGKQQALARWQPTADYLSQKIDSRDFEIVPLTHEEFEHAINKGQLDFILTNPGHYIILEVKFGATRIATFKSRFHDKILTQFGSVVFVAADSEIKNLKQLPDHSMAAVSDRAFGGFQLVQNELLDQGIDVNKHLTLRWLGFPQTDIVRAVIAGKADAGTVRSGILEKMAASGEIDLSGIRVLDAKESETFPLLHSTRLYPEWPIARLPATDATLAKRVAINLLQMPENAAPALTSGGAGWTIPLDYLTVHELFRKLQLDPYPPQPLDLKEFWQAYRHWVFLLIFLFLVSISTIVLTLRFNRQLKLSQRSLSEHRDRLEATIEQRTAELSQTNQALQKDIESRVQFENTLHEGSEVLHMMNTISNRYDLSREQRLQSILDLACQYLSEEIAVFSFYDDSDFNLRSFSSANAGSSVPLDEQNARQALDEGQIVHFENQGDWRSYVACSVYITEHRTGLLELGSPYHLDSEAVEHKTTMQTELGQQILHLLVQWVANQLMLLDYENNTDSRYQESRSRFVEMTAREREVLQLVADGESNKGIARVLNISTKTVELHRSNLLRKTSAGSSVQLIKLATQSRLID